MVGLQQCLLVSAGGSIHRDHLLEINGGIREMPQQGELNILYLDRAFQALVQFAYDELFHLRGIEGGEQESQDDEAAGSHAENFQQANHPFFETVMHRLEKRREGIQIVRKR